MSFSVTSISFKDGDYLANDHALSESYGFGCAGNNQSPHLAWGEPPAGTESFAVTCFDPDAPTGSGFWHWLVINIPANVRELALGASGNGMPVGALETRTDFGGPGYGGPCPPKATTRTAILSPCTHAIQNWNCPPTSCPRWLDSTCISRRWRRPRSWGFTGDKRDTPIAG